MILTMKLLKKNCSFIPAFDKTFVSALNSTINTTKPKLNSAIINVAPNSTSYVRTTMFVIFFLYVFLFAFIFSQLI